MSHHLVSSARVPCVPPVTPCVLCSSTQTATHRIVGRRCLRRCAACGIVFAAGAQYDVHVYSAEYFAARGHIAEAGVCGISRAKRRTFLHYLRKLRGTGRLLEIGCSSGLALQEAAALGWDVHGVEVSDAAAEAARLGLRSASIEADIRRDTRDFPDGTFQAVVMFDVLEHFATPADIGPELRRLTAPAGQLLVVTPDVASLSARLMAARWPHYLDEHLNYYSQRSLHEFMARYHFRLIQSGPAGKYVTFSMLRRHAEVHAGGILDATARLCSQVFERVAGDFPFWFNIGEIYALAVRTA